MLGLDEARDELVTLLRRMIILARVGDEEALDELEPRRRELEVIIAEYGDWDRPPDFDA
jgi:hypothetical protein